MRQTEIVLEAEQEEKDVQLDLLTLSNKLLTQRIVSCILVFLIGLLVVFRFTILRG